MLAGELAMEELAVRWEYGDCGRFIGVKRVRGDTSGEQRYRSLPSASDPYPLSISAACTLRCFTTFTLSGGAPKRDFAVLTGDDVSTPWTSYNGPRSRNLAVS